MIADQWYSNFLTTGALWRPAVPNFSMAPNVVLAERKLSRTNSKISLSKGFQTLSLPSARNFISLPCPITVTVIEKHTSNILTTAVLWWSAVPNFSTPPNVVFAEQKLSCTNSKISISKGFQTPSLLFVRNFISLPCVTSSSVTVNNKHKAHKLKHVSCFARTVNSLSYVLWFEINEQFRFPFPFFVWLLKHISLMW